MLRTKRSIVLSLAISGILATSALADPTTQPSTQPAVANAPATQPGAVDALLKDIDSAYSKLASARFDGTISGRFDVRGELHSHDATFTSSFAAPNKFRHETKDDALVASTGSTVFTYLGQRDQFQSGDAPRVRSGSSEWPTGVTKILNEQNPSLLLALSNSAGAELKSISKAMTLEQPTVVNAVSYPTLRLDMPADHQIVTLLIDPETHLLRRVSFDYRIPMQKAGTVDVKQAEVTIDYVKAIADAPVDANQFAWTPPAGAALVTTAVAMEMADDSPDAVKDLVGKTAPDFSLKKLDDKDFKLSDLKGSVVVIDFWATWCGPCVASLPHLNELYKDEAPNGLKVVAVNLQEDKETVQSFVEKKKWTLPVALDTDGAVAQKYKANAIPETVVVGKDGMVKQVFVGSGNEDAIKEIVAKEMK